MYIIADSGSTKTDWCAVDKNDGLVKVNVQTSGINPIHQKDEDIRVVLEKELLPALGEQDIVFNVDEVFFYGAGCIPETHLRMKSLIGSIFPEDVKVEVATDLLGAARALCGCTEGIACILGTGANSCLYDGNGIVDNVPPLGYILGDEGSGAVLGKLFLNALLKRDLPKELGDLYFKESGLTYSDIIENVYRKPLANRFMAGIAKFIACHKDDFPMLCNLVMDNFHSFFRKNVVKYKTLESDCPVSAVGSIAWFFREELREVATLEGFTLGTVCRAPMDGLIRFHLGENV